MTKTLFPFLLLAFVALGCVGPGTIRRNTPANAPSFQPTIDVTPIRLHSDRVSTLAEFEVKNTSNRTLEFLKMDASFYDKDENFITGESLYHIARYEGLPPGGRSTGLVQTPYDSRIRKVRITFSCNGETAFSKVDVIATEVPKLR